MKIHLAISFLVISALHVDGQIPESKIDKKDLKTFVRILASDSLEGRGTGSDGQKKATEFISGRFTQLGLMTFDQGSYLQKFTLNQTYWGQVYIKTKNKTLQNFDEFVFQGNNQQNEELEKEVVFGGAGTEEELNKINVAGRLVFVFIKNLRATYDIASTLEKRNAYGVIVANPENDKQFESVKNTYKDYALQKRLSFPNSDTVKDLLYGKVARTVNTLSIPNSEIKGIIGLSQRELSKLIETKRIEEVPIVKLNVKFEKIHNEVETANVIGLIRGKSTKAIVISAHYDHLGKSGNEYFPGADDNASGTAALLELAEEFSNKKDLPYTIMFLATSGEEAGLLGSFYHVSRPDFNPKNIVCNLNLDMISRSDDKHDNNQYLYCIGTDQSKEIDALIRNVDTSYDKCSFDYSLNNSKDPSGLYSRSDQYNFYKKGILAIQFFSGLHADYHKPTDTVEKIDFNNLENRVRLISLVLAQLESQELKN